MIIDLAELETSARPFRFTIPKDELDLEDVTMRPAGDVQVAGEVRKGAAQIDVKGTINAPAEIECARCLTPISQELKIDFVAVFVSPENFATDKEREVAAEDLDLDVLDNDRLDLRDVVREQLLLHEPEQVFCKPDCKGLCPKCGADRNLIDCSCDLDESDPRWAALKNWG